MALTAFDRAGERPPISQHRAFPGIVALWFAALLGFGSMVVPAALLERGVALTGIAAFVPAASPPLGLTARVIIALVAAVAGAAAGVAIARRVARAGDSDRPLQEHTYANGARRPLDVTTELGEGLTAGFGQPVTRRRALAIAEDDRASDDLYTVPLPAAEVSGPISARAESIAPTEVADPVIEPYREAEVTVESAAEAWPADDEPATIVARDFEPLPSPPASETSEQPCFERPEGEPLPQTALSQGPETDAVALNAEPVEPLRPAAPRASDEPELVQLAHRLKTSLERRRELAGGPATASPPAPPADFEPAPADDAVQAIAAYFGRPSSAPPPVTAGSEEEDEESEEFDDSYSSLLAMRGPYTPRGNARVPVELPEAAEENEVEADPEQFEPGAGIESDPAEAEGPLDTDAALRAALAKLQRMSGTA